ncbi:MAG: zinc ribbon domain-containing protein [Ideonella sp.]
MNATTAPAPGCGNCGVAMRALPLAGHYGSTVTIDVCQDCDLVWFDDVETARLSGPGLLELIGAMASAQRRPHNTLSAAIACPRCRGPVRGVHNRSRWGTSMQLACLNRHGAYQTFAQFLAEKGLTRPMSSADRTKLLQRDGAIHCINCGAQLDSDARQCRWCESVPAVVDVARLAASLDPEQALTLQAVHATPVRKTALACLACGAAVPREAAWSCPHCGATLVTAGLAEAHRQVAELEPALRAHARKPAPEVIKRRLEAQDAGLQRQREWAADMQAQADAQSGRLDADARFDFAWFDGDIPLRHQIGWLALALTLLAMWFWW